MLAILMSIIVSVGCIGGLTGCSTEQESKDDGVLKILSIGNSFSVDAQEYLYHILEDMGVEEIKLGNLYVSGCTLATHLVYAERNYAAYTYYTNTDGDWKETKNYSIEQAVKSENWDYITFQQASGSSGISSTYDDLDLLIDIVKPLCPEAKLVWHMTWAYQQDSTHKEFVKYDSNQTTMYNAIVSAVNEKIEKNSDIDFVIPAGTAIQNARTSYIGDNLTIDGHHLSLDLGRYIAGLTFAYALTGLSIDNVEYQPEAVTERQKQVAIEAVKNCFARPYEVTESVYTTEN